MLSQLLPQELVPAMATSFPFYGGAIALILGVLAVGSEYGTGTLKTLFTQKPDRLTVFAAKMAALLIMLLPFVLLNHVLAAISSVSIGMVEGLDMSAPPTSDVILSVLSGWIIMAVWATLGVLLATATRGTSLAIGIGILWGLGIEGMISAFADDISWLNWMNDVMIRSNAYSFTRPLANNSTLAEDGPGYFAGPFVSVPQAGLMLTVLAVISIAISAWLWQRRDVT